LATAKEFVFSAITGVLCASAVGTLAARFSADRERDRRADH
jgi:hypothetical protein